MVNALKHNQRYMGLGPAEAVLSTGAVQEAGTAADGASVWTLVTCEAIIDGVLKYCYATAEILDWQSAAVLEAGEQCYYLASFDGSDTDPNASVTVTQGTEYDATTETAVLPAIPSNEAALCAILVKTTDNDFTPSTTNFNATGVTTTFYTFKGSLPSGTSALPSDVDKDAVPDPYTIDY